MTNEESKRTPKELLEMEEMGVNWRAGKGEEKKKKQADCDRSYV